MAATTLILPRRTISPTTQCAAVSTYAAARWPHSCPPAALSRPPAISINHQSARMWSVPESRRAITAAVALRQRRAWKPTDYQERRRHRRGRRCSDESGGQARISTGVVAVRAPTSAPTSRPAGCAGRGQTKRGAGGRADAACWSPRLARRCGSSLTGTCGLSVLSVTERCVAARHVAPQLLNALSATPLGQ